VVPSSFILLSITTSPGSRDEGMELDIVFMGPTISREGVDPTMCSDELEACGSEDTTVGNVELDEGVGRTVPVGPKYE